MDEVSGDPSAPAGGTSLLRPSAAHADPARREGREHLRLASSRPMALVTADPADDPLSHGTPRPALTSIVLKADEDYVEATTTLALHGRVLSGTCVRGDGDRASAIAAATLLAVAPLLAGECQLDTARVIQVTGRHIALAIVTMEPVAEPATTLVGSALVRGDLEDAIARSVLSALNRRLSR